MAFLPRKLLCSRMRIFLVVSVAAVFSSSAIFVRKSAEVILTTFQEVGKAHIVLYRQEILVSESLTKSEANRLPRNSLWDASAVDKRKVTDGETDAGKGISRFTFNRSREFIAITAHLSPASKGDFGQRPCPYWNGKWTITSPTLMVRLSLQRDPHPDILSLICFITFQDWLAKRVRFPMSVSPRLVEALALLKPGLHVENVNPLQAPYKNDAKPNELVLSFGGGHDSSAVALLFPEAILVQNVQKRKPLKDWGAIPAALKEAAAFWKSKNRDFVFAVTNSRYLASSYGLLHWMGIFVPALLYAADQGKFGVLTGSNLASSVLNGGKRSTSARLIHRGRPAWQLAFERVGLPVMHGSLGMSVILAAKIVLDSGAMHRSFYCNAGKDGKWCHRCTKCLRKELAVRAACELSRVNVFNSTMIPKAPTWLERYPSHIVQEVFGKNVKEYRHATIGCSRILLNAKGNGEGIPKELLKKQVESATAKAHKTDFLLHHWANGLRFMSGNEGFWHFAKNRFEQYGVPNMTKDEEQQLHRWVVEPDV